MAQRLKTCQFAFPVLASLTNNTLTNLQQITIYIPESSVTIRKAWVEISMDDQLMSGNSGDGTITTKTVDLRLGGGSYSTTTNTSTLGSTQEHISLFLDRDFTSYFQSNWTGTSMTCDVRVQINQTQGSNLGMLNVCCILNITYEYDDTSSTHLKTVWIPLNAPSGALPIVKTSHDTIPALDSYLPEASKNYRDIFIVTQSNLNQTASGTYTINYELSSLGATGINYNGALSTDRWSRFVWDLGTGISTTGTYSFNVHSSIANRSPAMQAWMTVTYEFDPSSTTGIMNSLIIPTEIPQGSNTSLLSQRSIKDVYIQETGVSLNRLANYLFWTNGVNENNLNFKIGSGSYFNYTTNGSTLIAGNKGAMVRNDNPSGITFSRGKNTLFLDTYNTSLFGTSNSFTHPSSLNSLWMINYTSSKHNLGIGAHNHTVFWPVYLSDNLERKYSKFIISGTFSNGITIPETNYFVTAHGMKLELMQCPGSERAGISILAQRVSGLEGNYSSFQRLYGNDSPEDGELGLKTCITDNTSIFKRYSNDWDLLRLDVENDRNYVLTYGQSSPMINSLSHIFTYHSIYYTVSGNITNSNGGTVGINLHRHSDKQRLADTSRVGNGPYTLTWFDNTEPVYCVAYENNSYKGISGTGIAS